MNVLYVGHTSLMSGAERALLEILRTVPPGVTPALLCPPGNLAEEATGSGVPVSLYRGTDVSLRLNPVSALSALGELAGAVLAIRRAARRTNADLIHANSIRAGVMAVIAAPLHRRPVVVHLHDALPENVVSRLVRRLLIRRANGLIAISEYTRARFLRGMPPARIDVLYNPIDVSRFSPRFASKAEARRELDLPAGAPIFAIIAQITPWKGQDVAIRALAEVRHRFKDAQLLIVGEAKFVSKATRYDNLAYERSLKATVQRLGLGEAVTFLGEREDVPAIMRASDAVLAPSWEEPLGRSVLEAMASGTPVIATTIGGPAEVIADGANGFLVPPRDHEAWAATIERLLTMGEGVEALTDAARDDVTPRFATATISDELRLLYDRVVASGSSPMRGRDLTPG
jgi:glycosyltransferase involved in cell wall biosynthesis